MELSEIREQAAKAAEQVCDAAKLRAGDLFVVGCSSSEIQGEKIGSHSSVEVAEAVFEGIYGVLRERDIYLAAQCCEHLNRALVLEREAALRYGYDPASVVPWKKGGGSFATAAFYGMKDAVVVEHIRAHAGMDIGDVLIGMHLRDVAVPVRLSVSSIGGAHLVAARTRPKYIGGERAHYQ